MNTLFLAIIIGMTCGAMGFWLRQHTKLTVVEVSALLAVAAGLILPPLFQEGNLFAAICTAVSYIAMSSSQRIGSYRHMLLASALCAGLNYFGQNVLVGIGGRLGTSAALSILIISQLESFVFAPRR